MKNHFTLERCLFCMCFLFLEVCWDIVLQYFRHIMMHWEWFDESFTAYFPLSNFQSYFSHSTGYAFCININNFPGTVFPFFFFNFYYYFFFLFLVAYVCITRQIASTHRLRCEFIDVDDLLLDTKHVSKQKIKLSLGNSLKCIKRTTIQPIWEPKKNDKLWKLFQKCHKRHRERRKIFFGHMHSTVLWCSGPFWHMSIQVIAINEKMLIFRLTVSRVPNAYLKKNGINKEKMDEEVS